MEMCVMWPKGYPRWLLMVSQIKQLQFPLLLSCSILGETYPDVLFEAYGAFSFYRTSGSASDRMLETDVQPPRNGVQRPHLIGLGRSLGRPTVCLQEAKYPTSNSSTYQMVFQGVPSNIHSFPVSHLDHWKGKLVWFCNNIHSTNRSYTGQRGNL